MKHLVVGKIVGTHGIKGEVKVYILTDYPEDRFIVGETVHLGDDITLVIDHVRYHKGMALITFKDHPSINDVLKYKGLKMSMAVEEDDHEGFFYHQLIGLKVIDEKGQALGIIDSIVPTEAHDILRVKKANGKYFMIPYVDAFIIEEDLAKATIQVALIPGLDDEN